MIRLIVSTLLVWTIADSPARADGLSTAEAASRAWAITDAVLARHVEPPLRQQMLLAGIKAMALQARGLIPADLPRQVSDLTSADQLATLLADVLGSRKVEGVPRKLRLLPIRDEMTPEDVFLEGVLSAVPGGASLIPEKERKVQESFEANLYVGVQIRLGVDEKSKRPVFMEIFEGGPADNAGARAGDLIEELDGDSTAPMPLRQVVDRLRGAEGTDVVVRFRRPSTGEVFTRPMTRGRLPRPTILGVAPLPGKRQAVRFDGQGAIGYLKVTEISGSTPQELRAFAAQLESEGAKALVLDLRETDSARFHEAVLLADALLDGGVIGQVASAQEVKTYRAEPDALFLGWPIAVLVEGNHQPAVAWLADALRDNHRATILGEPALLRDPTVLETIALPGGEWSVQIATGRLRRGDGQPLAYQATKRPAPAPSSPGSPRDLGQDRDVARAREILAEALKSPL